MFKELVYRRYLLLVCECFVSRTYSFFIYYWIRFKGIIYHISDIVIFGFLILYLQYFLGFADFIKII